MATIEGITITGIQEQKHGDCLELMSSVPLRDGMSWGEVAHRLMTIKDFDEDWDGAGAPRIPPETISLARSLSREFRNIGYAAPQRVYATPDACVVFLWIADTGRKIEIEFCGDQYTVEDAN